MELRRGGTYLRIRSLSFWYTRENLLLKAPKRTLLAILFVLTETCCISTAEMVIHT